MILYETSDSTFFQTNREYCELIEAQLKEFNGELTGSCNCFGYEISTKFERTALIYNLTFTKNQTTQNGITVPVDSVEYAGVKIEVVGLPAQISLHVGRSGLRRLFSSNKYKSILPTPYFIRSNIPTDDQSLIKLADIIEKNKISTIEQRKGTLKCTIHSPVTNIAELLVDMEQISPIQ